MLTLVGLLLTYSQAGSLFKSFDVESAIVHYEIEGGDRISGNSYHEIDGKSTLIFAEWGARKLYKEKYTELTTGSVKNTNIIRTLHYEDQGVVYRVDFKNKKIEATEDPIIKAAIASGEDLYKREIEDMKAKGKMMGTSSVLGYRCNRWLYKGKKWCFYKGIPLKVESLVSGVPVTKVATSIDFDNNISEASFILPEFKEGTKKGFIMKEGKETHIQNIQKIDKSVKAEVSDSTIAAELKNDEVLTEGMFRKQKDLLPELLSEIQESRVCLENADDLDVANLCLSKLLEVEEKISGEKNRDREIALWTKITKEDTLDELEREILDMKRKMPCIRRSQNFDDLSKCMQESDD